MGKHEKLINDVLSGRQDGGIRFAELCGLLIAFGFSLRVNGSHHIFYKEGVAEIINLQPKGQHAKPYQTKQVRGLILKYKLEETK